MSEAINKRHLSTKDERAGHLNSYATAPASLGFDESKLNHRRTEIKSIPFNGLLTNRLLARLSGEDFERLLQHMEPVWLAAGDYVYGFGDGVDFTYFPETSVVSHIQLLEDGSTAEVALIGSEGMVGLTAVLGAAATSYWSQVIVAGSALRIRVEVIKDNFHRNPSIQKLVLAYASLRIAQISQRAVCNGRHTLFGRLCSWLLMIQDRAGDSELMLTHEEIARHLGARRASISVAATILRDKGIISYNRGHLRIMYRDGLLDCACECYRMLTRYE